MPGESRRVLRKMNHLLVAHKRQCDAIRKKSVHGFWHLQNAKQDHADLSCTFAKTILSIIKEHLTYLNTPDPYNRVASNEQINVANYKKAVFTNLLNSLGKTSGQHFIDMLSGGLETLKHDTIIDQPRWPRLTLSKLYELFIGTSKKEGLEPKTRVKDKALREPHSRHINKF